MKRATIIGAVTVLYTMLFLYTAISKVMDYSVFKEQLSESPILKPFATSIATGLPVLEFLIVLMLVVPKWRLKGFYLSLCLMMMFTIYVVAILMYSEELPCSCGGVLQQLTWPQHIMFNCAFIAMALGAISLIRKQRNDANTQFNSILAANAHV